MQVPLEAILTIIRENLNDRYRRGFPIIKELLQNADDVGATRLDFGLVSGLPGAQHPLLSGEALFVINDGPFSDEDARAINSIGLSRKPDDKAAVGKFGLGLKSLFHLCEAFFYVASGRPGLQFVNPWAEIDRNGADVDRYHPDWNVLSPKDERTIRNQLRAILGSSHYLCLWFPLRKRQHLQGRAAIMDYYPGDDGVETLELFSRSQNGSLELPGQLAAVMPLLQTLHTVTAWELGQDSEQPRPRLRVAVRPKSQRRRPLAELMPDKPLPLAGQIGVEAAFMPAVTLSFAGLELLVAKPELAELKVSEYWPRSNRMETTTGAHALVPHVAEPHAAAHFVRLPGQMPAILEIWRAVFLPVDEPFEPVEIEGNTSYRLTLHGDFFVDAGRSRIEGWVDPQPAASPSDTHTLREAWNRRLAQEGTLLLVLPALERFARATRLSASNLLALTAGLRQSGLFVAPAYRRAICRWQKWVYCVSPDKQGWQLLPAHVDVLPIPKPPDSAPGRPFEVCPEFQHFPYLSFPNHPQLATSDELANWGETQLLQALQIPVEDVFAARVTLEYLVQFIAGSGFRIRDSAAVVGRLQAITRHALVGVGLESLRAQTGLMAQFVALIPSRRRCVLKLSDSQHKLEGVSRLMDALLSCDIGGLVVPDEFDPSEAPAEGKLEAPDCVRLLQALAEAEVVGPTSEELEDARTGLALQILAQTDQRTDALALVRDLALFRARRIRSDVSGSERLSLAAIRDLARRGLLFKFAPPPMPEGLARALQAALHEAEVVLIPAVVAEALDNASISACDAAACLRALAHHPELAGPKYRARLLNSLLPAVNLGQAVHVESLRYLLHGVQAQGATRVPLYVDRHDVWSRMAVQALALGAEEWRVVPDDLAELLTPRVRAGLDVVEFASQSVVDLLRTLTPEELGRISGDALAPGDCEPLLRELNDPRLLRRLRIHERADGGYSDLLAQLTYLPGPFQLDPELQARITLLRPVHDPVLIARYQELGVVALDAAAAIRVSLSQPDPQRHWRTLLAAVEHLDTAAGLSTDLRRLLAKTAWLPLRQGPPVRPEDVLYLPQLADQVDGLLASAPGHFVSVYALAEDVVHHRAFEQLTRLAMPPEDDAITMLGEFMRQSPTYCLGLLGSDAVNASFLEALVETFGSGPGAVLLPAATILGDVQRRLSSDSALSLLRELRGDLSSSHLVHVLQFLSDQHSALTARRGSLLKLFNIYLGLARVKIGFEAVILPQIRLLSRKGKWKPADQLCFRVEGIDDADLLNDDQGALVRLVTRAAELQGRSQDPAALPVAGRLPRATEALLNQSAEKLRVYFQGWEGAVDRPIVGGFLSLLGDHAKIVKLAKEYLGNRDVAETREMLEWRPLELEIGGGQIGGYGEDAHQAIGYQRYLLELIEPKTATVRIRSLLGSDFDAHLLSEDSLQHLIVEDGHRLPPELQGGLQVNQLRLRRIEPARFTTQELSTLLRETARILLRTVYYQSVPNLDEFWAKELEHSGQLDIEIAQDWIIESAFAYLPQLGLRTDLFFGPILQQWEKARTRAIQVKHIQRLRPGHKSTRGGEDDQQLVQAQLKAVFDDDAPESVEPRHRLVEAVRTKVAGQYQYGPQAVLLELFQNADDAVAEIDHMMGERLPSWRKRVVIGRDHDAVFLVHWGRAINQFQFGGFDGSEHGYEADLSKMLMLQGSDKPGASQPVALTGKFGLGFKTVFLITERPEVISGRLGFEIVGAMYPRRLPPDRYTQLRARVDQLTPDATRAGTATLFDLCPTTAAEKQYALTALDELRSLAPLLVVFARTIDRCDIVHEGGPPQSVQWQPAPVLNQTGLDVGILTLPQGQRDAVHHTLVLRADAEKLLLVLGPRGFRPLAPSVPTIWVTVPTQEKHNLGFAVNAAFEVDVGRAQLARASDHNRRLAQEIGTWVGERLLTLYSLARTDWPQLLQTLGLSADLDPYDFWESLWEVLAGPFAMGPTEETRDLLRSILGASHRGYARLAEGADVIPTQLWGPHRSLTSLGMIQHLVSGKLNTEKIFLAVCRWPQFASRAPVGSVVSARTGQGLRGLLRDSVKVNDLTLSQAVRWEVSRDATVTPDLAGRLGGLLTPEFLTTLDAAERAELSEHLGGLAFRARNNRVQPAKALVIGIDPEAGPDEQDELARAKFAPDDNVLAESYTGPAVLFFRACREKLQAPVERMTLWVLTADSEGKRDSVLRYLLNGEQGRKLARALRAPDLRSRFDRSWLAKAGEMAERLMSFEPGERQQLLGLLELEPAARAGRPIPARVALRRIQDWWQEHQTDMVRQYERDTYPHRAVPQLTADAEALDPVSQKHWLTLFLLGASHTIGRAQPEAHRNFLELCESRGWLQVFADPNASAQQWIEVLDTYLETWHDHDVTYFHWMRQFVAIYQLSRHLEVYREAFLSIPRFKRDFRLNEITKLRASAAFQGSGLSAPSLERTLGLGACFVVRELVRLKSISAEHAHPYCYVPLQRIRECFAALGCVLDEPATVEHSRRMHAFLVEHLGPQDATFNHCFDLPFQAITREGQSLQEFLADI